MVSGIAVSINKIALPLLELVFTDINFIDEFDFSTLHPAITLLYREAH
jgi:hypothetical protein